MVSKTLGQDTVVLCYCLQFWKTNMTCRHNILMQLNIHPQELMNLFSHYKEKKKTKQKNPPVFAGIKKHDHL